MSGPRRSSGRNAQFDEDEEVEEQTLFAIANGSGTIGASVILRLILCTDLF